MKLAFEAPLKNIDLAVNLGDYIFAIAPMFENVEYSETIRRSKKELFLDNGEYEGQRLDVQDLLALCAELKPNVIVAPDVIGDAWQTIRLASDFLERLPERRPKVMVVPQGQNNLEKRDCIRTLKPYGIDIIGLGLGAFYKDWRERFWFARMFDDRTVLHILGAANLYDVCLWRGVAATLDTSLPFHLAQERKGIFVRKGKKRLDWNSPLDERQIELAKENIQSLRSCLRHA